LDQRRKPSRPVRLLRPHYYGTNNGNQLFGIAIDSAGNLQTEGVQAGATAPYSLTDSNWHQIALSYDGSGTLTYFVDGQQIGTAGGSLNTVAGPGLEIGNGYHNGTNASPYSGKMDEVAIYGTALTPTRINAHYLAAAAVACPQVPNTGYAGAVAADSPVRYYRLGETSGRASTDYSGNCMAGSYNYRSGHATGAVVGDPDGSAASPSGGEITALGSAAGLPTGQSARTIEVWVNTTSHPGQYGFYDLITYGTNNGNQLFGIAIDSAGNLQSEGAQTSATDPYPLTDGNWHQIALSYDGSGTLTYFADGQQIGTSGISPLATNLSQTGLLLGNGYHNGNYASPYYGKMDEVSIYATALTPARINAHFRSAAAVACPQVASSGYAGSVAADSPLRYYRLGETSRRVANDSSGNCMVGAYNYRSSRVPGALIGDIDGAAVSPSGGEVTAEGSAAGLPSGTSARSAEVWVNTASHPGQYGFYDLLTYGTNWGNQLFGIAIDSGGNLQSEGVDFSATVPYSITDGNWHQIVLTWDGSIANYYLDGQQLRSASVSFNTNLAGTGLLLGNGYHNGNYASPYYGKMDEVAVYGTALSSARVLAHYLASAPQGGAFSGSQRFGGGNACMSCAAAAARRAHGYPVDSGSGNMWDTTTDISIAGRGYPLEFSRTYNSSAAGTNGPLGYGWHPSVGMTLTQTGSTVTITQENASTVAFNLSGSTWSPAAPRYLATLTHNGDGTWTFKRQGRDAYTFNSGGQLTGMTDLNGYTTSFTYSAGNLSTITDSSGRSLSLTWTGSHIAQITDANVSPSRTVQYQYNDGNGNLTDVFDVGGNHWKFVYDSSHRLTSMFDPNCLAAGNSCNGGNGIQTHYDGSGRVDWQKDQLGRQTSFDYNSAIAGATKITDPSGNVTAEYYDQGLLVAETKGYGTADAAMWSYAYDSATLAQTISVDPNGNQTSYTVDSSGNVLTVTDPLGRQTVKTYNSLNEVLTAQDPKGVVTTNTFDANGNMSTTCTPLTTAITQGENCTSPPAGAQLQQVTYNHADGSHPGDVTSMVDADSKTWNYSYDANGYRSSITDPLSNQSTSSFNAVGWLTSSVSPKGNVAGCGCAATYTTSHAHNSFGQTTTTTDPLNHTTTRHYDADQNLDTFTDGNNNLTTYVYDLANQLTQTKRADSPQTTLATDYNADGTVLDQKDGKGNATLTYGYDHQARVTSMQDALGNATTYSYDGAGNRLTELDPVSGATCTGTQVGCTNFSYDAANELTGIAYSDGVTPNVSSIQYDADGQRTAMTDGSGTSSWARDSLRRLTSSTNGNGAQVQYQYNLRNLETKVAYPGGNCGAAPSLCLTRAYDDAGRWISVQDWNSNTTNFGYDANSNLTSETLPAGTTITDTSTFDAANRLMSMTVQANGTALNPFPITYGRDSANQLISDSSAVTSQSSYRYSALNQVCYAGSSSGNACSSPPGGSQPFAYDAADNLTTFGGTTQQFNAANQLCWTVSGSSSNSCASAPSGATTFSFDTRGNRTAVTPASGPGLCNAYDQVNRLTSIKTGTGSSCSSPTTLGAYAYNGDGLRMSKTVGSATTQFAWDISGGLPLLLQEQVGAGTPTRYVYGPGGMVLEQLTSVPGITQVGTPNTAADANGTGSGLVLNLPSGLQAGDQIILATTYPAGVNHSANTPSGYTPVGGAVNSGGTPGTADQTQVFRRTAQSGDASVTISYSTPFPRAAVVTVYRGVDPYTPIDVIASGNNASSGGSSVSASATTNYPNEQLVLIQGATYSALGAGSWSAPGSMTERGQKDATTATIGLADKGQAAAGSTGTLTSTFSASTILSGPQLTAVVIGLKTPPTTIWYHHDQLGSVRLLTDSAGAPCATYTFDPYGNIAGTTPTEQVTNPFQFAGEYRDAESGLYYLRARYYDPGTGQFLSRDPLVATTREPYAYVGDNPLNLTDPSGLVFTQDGGGEGGLEYYQSMLDPCAGKPKETPGCTPVIDYPGLIGAFIGLSPNDSAGGPHTTFTRDPSTGGVNRWQTWWKNFNPFDPKSWAPGCRFDRTSDPHYNKFFKIDVPAPHVHDPEWPGGIRPPLLDEIP
jgi:RHS repeat-associated protein